MIDNSNMYERTEQLIGTDNLIKLQNAKVIIFGIGGVGGYVAESLARSGVGSLTIVDNDSVNKSNINRQIIATTSALGQSKVQLMKSRIEDINPNCKVITHEMFYLPQTSDLIDLVGYDYIVDAVDTVTAKLMIIQKAKQLNVPVISSMGTGNKTDPTQLKVCDIFMTKQCPLARVIRHELKARNIQSLKVVYSPQVPSRAIEVQPINGKVAPASMCFVPASAGLLIGWQVVEDLITNKV